MLGLTLLIALPVHASEKDELASAQHLLIQIQAALERARVAAVQADRPEQGRFWFDYSRVTSDLKTINTG
ncbi:RAQPRD family integrative conjugative element protein [Erwinia persicina]|nr:RAQPRD family integrative conjugative element protein [Erwinia persicina]